MRLLRWRIGPLPFGLLGSAAALLGLVAWFLWSGPWQSVTSTPSLLLTRAGWSLDQAHRYSQTADLLLPLASLPSVAIGERDLLRHRRALTAAWPTTAWQHLLRLGCYAAGPGLLWVGLAGVVPWAVGLPVAPLAFIGVLGPSVLLVTGAAYATSEAFRHPMTGLLTAVLWVFTGFFLKLALHPTTPYPGLILTVATGYPPRAAWTNRLETLALALLLWALGSSAYYWHRHRGDDI